MADMSTRPKPSPSNDPTALDITIDLTSDEARASQLGSSQSRNTKPQHETNPRDLITAKELPRIYYFHARFHSCRFGLYKAKPACLLIFDFDFQQLSSSRFKNTTIELSFEDAANVNADPHGDEDIDTTYQPRIIDRQPKRYVGQELVRDAMGHTGINANITPPGGMVGFGGDYGKDLPAVKKGALMLHSVVKDDPPSRIVLVARENNLANEGIPNSFSLPLIVSYTPGKKFAARLRVEADVWYNLGGFTRPMCGKKDDPLYFHPEEMKAAQEGAGDEDLALIDLQPLTRLNPETGKFFE